MRTLLLSLLFALASTAEVEQITLADGRHLTGTYDEAAGTITLDGPGAAVIKVRAYEVKKREAYARPVVVAAVKTDRAPSTATLQPSLDDQLITSLRAADAARKAAADAERVALITWLRGQDLEQLPVPDLSKDPRDSERKAAAKIRDENDRRRFLKSTLSRYDMVMAGKVNEASEATAFLREALSVVRERFAIR